MVESEKGIRGARRAGPGSGRRGGWGGGGDLERSAWAWTGTC